MQRIIKEKKKASIPKKTARKKILWSFLIFLIVFNISFLPFEAKNRLNSQHNFFVSFTDVPIAQADLTTVIQIIDPMSGAINKISKVFPDQKTLDDFLNQTPGATIESIVDSAVNPTGNGSWWDPSSWNATAWLAKRIAEYIINSILAVIYIVMWFFYSLIYGLTSLAEKILALIMDPEFIGKLQGFTTKDFVKTTAQKVADFCNGIYIFILIYIAIGTILGNVSTKKLLVKLVFAAFLTNFALVISGVIIDFSQVVMYSVWDGIKNQGGGEFTPGTTILNNLQSKLKVGYTGSGEATIGNIQIDALAFLAGGLSLALPKIIALGGLLTLGLALVVSLITITFVLMIRIVALWILLILSPAAFLLSVLPQTEKHWNRWFEGLTKYALSGPILVFFLWFALKAEKGVKGVAKIQQSGSNDNVKNIFFNFVAENVAVLFEMFTLIIIIWAGILIANEFGIAGAKNINGLINRSSSWGKKILRAPGKVLATTAGVLGRTNYVGSKILQGSRERKLEDLEIARSKAIKSRDLDKVKAIEDQIKQQQGVISKGSQARISRTKFFSAINPQMIKGSLADFWRNSNKEYMDDSESALREFGNKFFVDKLLFKKRRLVKNAGKFTENDLIKTNLELADLERERKEKIKKQVSDLGLTGTDEGKKRLGEINKDYQLELDKKNKEIIATYFSKSSDKEKKEIEDSILKNGFLAPVWAQKAIDLAEDQKQESWKESFYQKELFSREIKKAEERINKMNLTPEQIIRMIERGEGDRNTQIALLRKVSSSGKFFGDLIKKMTDNFDLDKVATELQKDPKYSQLSPEKLKEEAAWEARSRAISTLGQRASENEVIAGMRAAEVDARKTHNLPQVGLVSFDKGTGSWKISNKDEQKDITGKFVSGWTPRDFTQIHPQTFDNSVSRQVLAESADWHNLSRSDVFMKNLSKSTHKQFVDYQKEFLNHITDQQQKTGFENVLSRTNPEFVFRQQNNNRSK